MPVTVSLTAEALSSEQTAAASAVPASVRRVHAVGDYRAFGPTQRHMAVEMADRDAGLPGLFLGAFICLCSP